MKRIVDNLKRGWRFLRLRPAAHAAAFFALAALAAAFVQSGAGFLDPDSYYHARFALAMLDVGHAPAFPWLPLTVLSRGFADHHLLYHLLLLPWVSRFGPIAGLHAATVIFSAGAMTALFVVSRGLAGGRSAAWVTAGLCLAVPTFVTRLNLAKASALAVAWTIIGAWLLRRGRPAWLVPLGFLYGWTHGSWPLLLLLAGVNVVATAAGDRRPAAVWSALLRAAAAALGVALALVVNPYFPANLAFLREQLVQVAVLGHDARVTPGTEWLPTPPGDLLAATAPLLLAALVGGLVALAAWFWPEQQRRPPRRLTDDERADALFFGATAAVMVGMTLMSRRHVEYLVPQLALFISVLLGAAARRLNWPAVSAFWQQFLRHRAVVTGAVTAIIVVEAMMIGRSLVTNRWLFRDAAVEHAHLAGVGRAIAAGVPPGELVFHAYWDDFPWLVLAAPGQRYVSGLDPNFLVRVRPDLVDLLDYVRRGDIDARQLTDVITRRFGARYALVTERDRRWGRRLAGDDSWRLVYFDEEAQLYEYAP